MTVSQPDRASRKGDNLLFSHCSFLTSTSLLCDTWVERIFSYFRNSTYFFSFLPPYTSKMDRSLDEIIAEDTVRPQLTFVTFPTASH